MELKAMFPDLTVLWKRWSEYQVVEQTFNRRKFRYLVPAPGATEMAYNCAEHAETMVGDALELGRQLSMGGADQDRLCANFAARYGLLGPDVELGQAIGEEPDTPPPFRPVGTIEYGEDMRLFQEEFKRLYQHFLCANGEEGTPTGDLTGLLPYRMTTGRTPQLIWEIKSLESVLRLTYAALITAPNRSLKTCKNCGRVYYNPRTKSKFCSTRCRNAYNVRAFREK